MRRHEAGALCARPVALEPRIDEVTTLGRLDIDELDVIARHRAQSISPW